MTSLKTVADQLGTIKAELADLREKETKLKQRLIESGVEEVEGDLFHVTVSDVVTKRVDYKKLIAKLQVSKRQLSHYTTETESVRVSVHSR